MAREILVLAAESRFEGNAWVGGVFMFCLVVASLSMISMVIFACGDCGGGKPRHKSGGSTAMQGAAAMQASATATTAANPAAGGAAMLASGGPAGF